MLKCRFKIFLLVFVLISMLGFVACTEKTEVKSEDILTQKPINAEKIPVTVLVKYAFSINTFEKAVEEKFPQLDLIQVGNYTSNMGTAEYEARLEHDDLTDMVMTWPLKIGEEYWEERLIDLSSVPFTGKYTTSMLDTISRDGKLFYLPGPSQMRGIVYNKTLFAEKGWQVPKDFDGFIKLCQEIEASGMRSLQLGFGNSEVFDTAFVGYGYESGFSRPKNAQWLSEYNSGKGSFGENFTPALETFQTLVDTGILKKEDLNVYYQDRERMLFARQCAMVEDSVLLARMGNEIAESTDEFALMPFFNPGGTDADWARLYPVCYVGLSKHLEEPENKEKYALIMEVLAYISTPEGQKALGDDTEAMISHLHDVKPPNIPETQALLPALNEGRYAIFPVLKNAENALREGLAGMLTGTMNAEDVIRMVDMQNANPPKETPPIVFGQATSDFSLIETGNFITDSMRDKSGCEIALFLDNGKDGRYNGKGVSGKIYEGDVTDIDINRILPDLKYGEKGELWKVTMTGEHLIQTLEYALPVGNNLEGWFYYFSGLKVTYDPTAKPGSRIHKITDGEGKEIDSTKNYSIAVMDYSVREDLVESCEKTGVLIRDILIDEIEKQGEIKPSGDNRFIVARP